MKTSDKYSPALCWIAEETFEYDFIGFPKTLTEMFSLHFLGNLWSKIRMTLPRGRIDWFQYLRVQLLALGSLALRALQEGDSVFHESDLRLHGVNLEQESIFSDIYTALNEGGEEERVYSFTHVSVQEFFAALYIYLAFYTENKNAFQGQTSSVSSELEFYKEAVDATLRSPGGQYDMRLRFLLGLYQEVNFERLVFINRFILHKENPRPFHDEVKDGVVRYIKERIRVWPVTERCRCLCYCLNELSDGTLLEESEGSMEGTVPPSQWASFLFVLRTAEEELAQFRLGNFVVKAAQKANLSACGLTESSCDTLSSLLSSSHIQQLDLSFNHISDAGLHKLCSAFRDSPVHTLRLKGCGLTVLAAESLSSLLSSAHCKLKSLDLSDNDCGDEGVQRLSEGLSSPHCGLEVLGLSLCRVTERGCTFLASALNGSVLKELDLSYNHPGEAGLQLLSALMEDPHCSLTKISVEECGESRIGPGPKKYTVQLSLDPATSHKDLSLSDQNRRATRELNPALSASTERFNFWAQVLCTQGLTGRCYWETEFDGRACVGVVYERMSRTGEGTDSRLGQNDSSWGLNCNKDGYRAVHNAVVTSVAVPLRSNRLGVLLDWCGGKLSFFSVQEGEPMHIFTFNANFSFPVFPAFHLAWIGSSIHLC